MDFTAHACYEERCTVLNGGIVLCQNTIMRSFKEGLPHDSSFLTIYFAANYQREHPERGAK